MDKLKISQNKRYFVKEDGTPFTWLADTDWTMPQRLKWDDALYLMQTRKEQGFTVLQIVALDPEEDLEMRNPVGEPALVNNNLDTPNEKYFEYLDWLLDEAEKLDLYILLLPVWGQLVVGDDWGGNTYEKTVNEENAYSYGKWIGNRYKERKNIIWCLGGDRMPIHRGTDYKDVWRKMAEGLAKGVTGKDLKYNQPDETWGQLTITYHACHEAETGECSTMSYWTDEETWISFIMLQSGHGIGPKNYELVSKEYHRKVTMPVWDGEPAYEMMPITWPITYDTPVHGSWMVRKRAYWALLAGAFGHTYGHASVWSSIAEKGRSAFFRHSWYEALQSEGSGQMKWLRAFMDDMQPQLGRPCQEILPADNEGSVTDNHLQANVNDANGSICVYFPSGGDTEIDIQKIWQQNEVWLWWYRPGDGKFYVDSETTTDTAKCCQLEAGKLLVSAPSDGAEEDWMLIIKNENSKPPIEPKAYYEMEKAEKVRKVFEW